MRKLSQAAEGCDLIVLVLKVGQAKPKLESSPSREAFPRIPLLQLGQSARLTGKNTAAVKAWNSPPAASTVRESGPQFPQYHSAQSALVDRGPH